MLWRYLEVALFVSIAICLVAPLLWSGIRRLQAARSGTTHYEPSAVLDNDRAPALGGDRPPVKTLIGQNGRLGADGAESRRRWAAWIGGTLFAAAIINFLAYSLHAGELGGSADKQVGERYYVASHGRYTEVTEDQWRAVRAHQIAVFVTHALGLVAGGLLLSYSQRGFGRAEAGTATAP